MTIIFRTNQIQWVENLPNDAKCTNVKNEIRSVACTNKKCIWKQKHKCHFNRVSFFADVRVSRTCEGEDSFKFWAKLTFSLGFCYVMTAINYWSLNFLACILHLCKKIQDDKDHFLKRHTYPMHQVRIRPSDNLDLRNPADTLRVENLTSNFIG